MYRWITRHLLVPLLDFWRGTKTRQCRRELEESQWWPRDKILELQNERLRKLINYAYERVPYYRRIFDKRALKPGDIERAQDLVKLPVLTKRLIRDNFDDITAQGFPSQEVISTSTGGATGETLKFYSTKDTSRNWGSAAARRIQGWAGYEAGDKVIEFRVLPPYRSRKRRLGEAITRFFGRILVIDTREMSPERLLLLARKLEAFKPAFIRGYPSAIYLLARLMEREGKPRLRPRAIIPFGEQLYDYQRELFTKVFRCEIYNWYSAHEASTMTGECSEHSGYHITAENHIIEIVDDEGKPVPVGGEGRILVTNLHNYAMPFIRYDIGDVGALSDKACPCGRGLPLLAKLGGRTLDFIRTKSGEPIPGLALPWAFLVHLGVEQFQMVQETEGEAVLKVVLDREYPREYKDEITKKVRDIYKGKIGEDLDITVEFVDQIPTNKAGKRSFVISNLPPREDAG